MMASNPRARRASRNMGMLSRMTDRNQLAGLANSLRRVTKGGGNCSTMVALVDPLSPRPTKKGSLGNFHGYQTHSVSDLQISLLITTPQYLQVSVNTPPPIQEEFNPNKEVQPIVDEIIKFLKDQDFTEDESVPVINK